MRRAITCFCVFLFFFLLGAAALADQGPDEVKCLPEEHSLVNVEGDNLALERRYSVPRKQVLMEEATATW